MSHPVWGAWIETVTQEVGRLGQMRRTPCGVRGLKLAVLFICVLVDVSHPVWGAWIETS